MKIPRHLLNSTATVKPYKGRSAYGPVYGGPLNLDPSTIISSNEAEGSYLVRCRYEIKKSASQRRTSNGNSNEIRKLGTVWFNGSALRPESLVIINGEEYFAGQTAPHTGLGTSIHHLEVELT